MTAISMTITRGQLCPRKMRIASRVSTSEHDSADAEHDPQRAPPALAASRTPRVDVDVRRGERVPVGGERDEHEHARPTTRSSTSTTPATVVAGRGMSGL